MRTEISDAGWWSEESRSTRRKPDIRNRGARVFSWLRRWCWSRQFGWQRQTVGLIQISDLFYLFLFLDLTREPSDARDHVSRDRDQDSRDKYRRQCSAKHTQESFHAFQNFSFL